MLPFSSYPEASASQVDGKTYDYIIVGGEFLINALVARADMRQCGRWDSGMLPRIATVRRSQCLRACPGKRARQGQLGVADATVEPELLDGRSSASPEHPLH